MSAAAVARIGYKGLRTGRRVVITGPFNTVIAVLGRLSPRAVSMAIGSHLMSPQEPA
jgi:hypothetical protein